MFGWTDTQEHAKMVATQLHRMSQMERWSGQEQVDVPDGGVTSRLSRENRERGAACVGFLERYRSMR